MARPTECTAEILEKCRDYVEGAYSESSLIPSIVGMCRYVGVARSTLFLWKKDNRNEQFSDYFEQCLENQEEKLLNGGLGGDFNPAITKMILTKHGYSDKIEQAHTSPDGTMSPVASGEAVLTAIQAKHK